QGGRDTSPRATARPTPHASGERVQPDEPGWALQILPADIRGEPAARRARVVAHREELSNPPAAPALASSSRVSDDPRTRTEPARGVCGAWVIVLSCCAGSR